MGTHLQSLKSNLQIHKKMIRSTNILRQALVVSPERVISIRFPLRDSWTPVNPDAPTIPAEILNKIKGFRDDVAQWKSGALNSPLPVGPWHVGTVPADSVESVRASRQIYVPRSLSEEEIESINSGCSY